MDFVLIANAWGAGVDNPTSKHRIALELARRGHRVLWVEGAGMRTPSLSSGIDRGRIVRKIRAAWRGPQRVWGDSRKPSSLAAAPSQGEAQETQEERDREQTLLRQGFQLRSSSYEGQVGGRAGCTGCGEGKADQEGNEEGLQSAVSSFQSDSGAIWVLSPLSVPLPRYELIRRMNGGRYAREARRACRRLDFANPVLINYVPVLAEAMRRWRRVSAKHQGPSIGHHIIYHCVDRWDAFAMYDSAMMRDMDERCCRYADVVIASSNDLFDRCREKNANTHLVMHGVDYEHFAAAIRSDLPDRETAVPPGEETFAARGAERGRGPADRVSGSPRQAAGRPADLPGGRLVGFFGLLSEWLDQDLLLKLAVALRETRVNAQQPTPNNQRPIRCTEQAAGRKPPVSIVLIGATDVDVSRLEGVPNIHLLGPKPFSELPEYIAHFEVGVIPFVLNELTRAVNPIKLREMMAAGCPVVSTALPEVEKFAGSGSAGGAVQVAHSRDEFVSAVAKCLAAPATQEQRRALSDQMRVETWRHKVDDILCCLKKEPPISG